MQLQLRNWNRVAVLTCAVEVARLPWNSGLNHSQFYLNGCSYEPAFQTWITCVNTSLTEQNAAISGSSLIQALNEPCEKFNIAITEDRFHRSLTNATEYLIDIHDTTAGVPLSYPVVLDDKSRKQSLHAYRTWFTTLDVSDLAAAMIYGYFVLVGLLLSISFPSRAWSNRLRARFVLPTITSKHASRSLFGGFIPTALEGMILAGYFLVHTFALVWNYQIDNSETIMSKPVQYLRILADRTGILAFAQLPLLIVFSTRFNFVELATGLKYTSLIVMHKWIGRVMVIDGIVHSLIYAIHAQMTGSAAVFRKEDWWVYGVLAFYASILLVILSLGRIREHCYELFLLLHIGLAAAFIYTCYIHCVTFGWLGWLYASMFVWIFERCQRLYSMYKFAYAGSSLTVNALIELKGHDIFSITIRKANRKWVGKPGQYVFVYFMLPAVFWQSHPFTFIDNGDHLSIVVKAKTGATGNILRSLQASPLGQISLQVGVEGPYGVYQSTALAQHLLLCGGSGIPGPLSHALELKNSHDSSRINMVIVSREIDLLIAYRQAINDLQGIELCIYYTGSHPEPLLEEYFHDIPVRYERPNLKSVIEEQALRQGSLSVSCCGPPSFVDITRNAVAHVLSRNPQQDIQYFEEYQTW